MTIANWCVLIACLLPIACAGIAKAGGFGRSPKKGGYDNNDPRGYLASLDGYRQRANAAQANSFEALPLFIAAVVLAQQAHADQAHIDQLAMAFIAVRVVYIAVYLADWATLRSLVWAAGLATSIAILLSK